MENKTNSELKKKNEEKIKMKNEEKNRENNSDENENETDSKLECDMKKLRIYSYNSRGFDQIKQNVCTEQPFGLL